MIIFGLVVILVAFGPSGSFIGIFVGVFFGGFGIYLLVDRSGEGKEFDRERVAGQRILSFVAGSDDVVSLKNMARKLDVSEYKVRVVIEEAVEGGTLVGQFYNEGRTFITNKALRKKITDRFE